MITTDKKKRRVRRLLGVLQRTTRNGNTPAEFIFISRNSEGEISNVISRDHT